MSTQQSSTRTPTVIGFAIGAVLAIAAALYVLLPDRPTATQPVADAAVPMASVIGEGASTTSPHPPMGEPSAAPPAPGEMPKSPHSFPAKSGAPGTPLLSGTISLDPAITQDPNASVTVFVIARTTGAKGRAVFARRMEVTSFPASFTITSNDAMSGEKPDKVMLEARIDLDGDAMTREPGSAVAVKQSVALGTSGIELTLKPDMGQSPS